MTNWITRLTGQPFNPGSFRDWNSITAESLWQRIAGLPVMVSGDRKRVPVGSNHTFRKIKLRCRGAEIDVKRWTLEFEDSTIVDLSVNYLPEGTESQPMSITGRRLTGVAVEYSARMCRRRGRLEIWAQE